MKRLATGAALVLAMAWGVVPPAANADTPICMTQEQIISEGRTGWCQVPGCPSPPSAAYNQCVMNQIMGPPPQPVQGPPCTDAFTGQPLPNRPWYCTL
jgi:hypothetical protein